MRRGIPLLLAASLIAGGAVVAAQDSDPVIVAAGDISPVGIGAQKATSNLAIKIAPTAVLTLGDNQYQNGELSNYKAYYHPTWGRLKAITYPAPGNHDPWSSGYRTYWGARAPSPYRSFVIGEWLILQLDSTRNMAKGSPQHSFVAKQLAANEKACVLAYWHHPRFSSGSVHGSNPKSGPIWQLLYQYRADVVLAGHDHLYERFAKLNPAGQVDAGGIRQFTSGLGGKSRYGFGSRRTGSQFRFNKAFGVLKMTLSPGGYEWRFLQVNGAVIDQGRDSCVS